MPKLIILGTTYSIPDEKHDNTHMVLVGQNSKVLIDCAGNSMIRLHQAKVDLMELTDIIITHFHPDHMAGLPLLLMNMWIMGRKRPLKIFGLQYTLDRIENLMALFSWEKWPNFYPIAFNCISGEEIVPVIDNDELLIQASQVNHLIPCLGLRMRSKEKRKVVAYSSDTEPCPQVIQLAEKADYLFHEATGQIHGHSSASQAGEIAQQAGVKALYLIHYPSGEHPTDLLTAEASLKFSGSVHLAEDFLSLDL